MEYKELLKNYFDNLGVEDYKTGDLRKARQDFADTLKSMYGKTKFPKKSYCEEFDKTYTLTEDFADSTFITGLTTSLPASQVIGGELVFNVDGTITYQNNLDNLDNIVISASLAGSPVTASTIKVSIDNQLGENLFLDTQNFVASGDYTFTPGLTNKCNFIVTITITLDGATSMEIQSLVFTFAKNFLTLPSDLVVPSRVIFTSSSGRELASSEIRFEEYKAWVPFRFTNPDGLTSEVTDPKERYVTEENILYDRTIGYLYLAEPSGVTLWWKPAVEGKVTLVYSALPTLNIEEGSFSNALEAFSDCLTAGATYRGLRRKAKDQSSEVSLSGLMLSMRDYKAEFKERFADWVEFTKPRATVHIVEPFDFLNDSDMLRG